MEEAISLFIPVYNIAQRLLKINLEKCYSALSNHFDNFEMIIIDDNSPERLDKSNLSFNNTTIDNNKVRYIPYKEGPSRRENLAKSFSLAQYDIIGFIDADLSCDISYLLKAIMLLKKESADIVIGSRYIKGAKVKRRIIRRILSFFYNIVLGTIFKSKIKDHQCGLKVFRKEILLPLIQSMGYGEHYIRGWFWDAELLIRAQKENLKIVEMPLEWHYADKSTFNIKREIRCLKSVAKLKEELKINR